jgi:sec-independent protein translocase protein TatC
MIFKFFLELRNRIILIIINWVFTIICCYSYKETLLYLVININKLNKYLLYFISTNITEIFITYLKISYFFSNQIIIFYIFYHIFIFLSPAFYLSEYKKIKNILFIITIFYCLSLLFFYYLLLPLSLNFFLKFQTLNNQVIKIYFEGKIIEYLNFYIYMYFICIMFFQSFVYIYIYLINKNIIDFVKFRKSSYFIFYFFSTLLTPPDLFSQLIMGLIFVILLEILLVFIFINKYVKKL